MSDIEIPYTFVSDTDAEAAQVNANFQTLVDAFNALKAQQAGAGLPLGVPVPFGGTDAPSGWLMCQGQAVSRSTYSALFAVLGTRFGAGNGTTTFNLPDLRKRVPVGFDSSDADFNALGKTGGKKEHTLTIAEMPAHNHGGSTGSGGAGTTGGSGTLDR